MISTAERLQAFVSEMGWSRADAARELGCGVSMLGHLLKGRRYPGRRLANQIEQVSRRWERGPIRIAEWDAEVFVPVQATGTDGE